MLDASFASAWFLPDESSEATGRLLDEILTNSPIVPSLFRHELRNLLLLAERRERVATYEIDEALIMASSLPINERGAGDDHEILRLARKHSLTAYDAAYLDLALRERLPLATLDKKLVAAAKIEGVKIIGPLGTA